MELRAFARTKAAIDSLRDDQTEDDLLKAGVSKSQIDWVMEIKTMVIERDHRRREA